MTRVSPEPTKGSVQEWTVGTQEGAKMESVMGSAMGYVLGIKG
jgi:hypothetical protein